MEETEIKAQVARLEACRKDAALVALIPRVVAAQFGVVPLETRADGTLEVAATANLPGPSVAALSRLLERPVAARTFDDGVLHHFLSRVYLQGSSLNFHTFVEEDFLVREASLNLLREEKEKIPVPPVNHLPADRLLFLDFAYRSELSALDRQPWQVHIDEETSHEIPYLLPEEVPPARGAPPEPPPQAPPPDAGVLVKAPPGPIVHRAERLPEGVLILARESRSTSGMDFSVAWKAHEISELPFMIHPSELQLTGIEADGSALFYVYDHVERVRPGESRTFDVTYHFLSMGNRLRRRLRLRIYGVRDCARDAVRYSVKPHRWAPRHFERWFGFDLV